MPFGQSAVESDPEIDMAPDEIIRRWGYKAEKYEVNTEDGYILPLYRIPSSKTPSSTPNAPRPVVYLQHGLENSAADWLLNLPTQSAPFIFADAGFDVFIGNFRGNSYSLKHVKLTTKDHAFWEFSWDEMALFDLPALINKTLEISQAQQIYYVAHSMGTMTGFALFSQDQVLAKKIKQFYALGPILSMKNVQGPVKYAKPFVSKIKLLTTIFGIDQFLPSNYLQELWAKYVCTNPMTDLICKNVLLMIGGPNTHQINATRVPVINSHSPAGTSVQNILHFGQLMTTGNFQAYDYGNPKTNQKHYGMVYPPLYDVSKFEIPIAFYSGDVDYLATPTDVAYTMSLFKNVIGNTYLENFAHMDFAWGIRAATAIYQPITKRISMDFSA